MLEAQNLPPASESRDADARHPAASRSRKAMFWLVRAAAVLLAVGGVTFIILAARKTIAPAKSSVEILAQLKAEVIPEENSPTGYGPAFNYAGYENLLEWNRLYAVDRAWAANFEAQDVTLPCCGFAVPSADESKNCGCGHHQALYGLSKKLLNGGYDREQTQTEIRRWTAYMFPQETLKAELERRALTDPEINRALEELKEKGEC
ncbi:MAG: hypothetical protein HYZ35_00655 [Chloroflexi bacterium]|nr:hypothetical protein [Chloroflexota bacterium]